jgi:hypothetical protein
MLHDILSAVIGPSQVPKVEACWGLFSFLIIDFAAMEHVKSKCLKVANDFIMITVTSPNGGSEESWDARGRSGW